MSEIDYRPNGEIVIDFDGTEVRLRRPKVGQYRMYNDLISEMRETLEQRSTRIAELRALLDTGEDLQAIRGEIAELNAPVFELTMPIVEQMIRGLAEKPGKLPGDIDDWPAWVTNTGLPGEFLAHWRSVPKASGGLSQN